MNYKHLALALFFVCCACESKPVKPREPGAAGANAAAVKPTREGQESVISIELQAELLNGPASAESTLLTAEPVLECLRQNIDPNNMQFSVHLQGKLDGKGKLIKPSADGGSPALKACMKTALNAVTFESGPNSVVKMHISRGVIGGPKMKGFVLEMKALKKFE